MIKRHVKKVRTSHSSSPGRVDPTQTTRLRVRFTAELRRQFNAVKLAILKFVGDEDAFGLKPNPLQQWTLTDNTFNPSQPRDEKGRWSSVGSYLEKVEGKTITQEIKNNFPEGPRQQYALSAAIADSPKWFDVLALRDSTGKLVSVASVWKDPDVGDSEGMPQSNYIRVGSLATAGRGVGETMVSHIIDYAKSKKAGVYLSAIEGSTPFYQRMGFKEGLGATQYLTYEDLQSLTTNAFCPTGEGGGVDPTCSPTVSDVSKSWNNPTKKQLERSHAVFQRIQSSGASKLMDRQMRGGILKDGEFKEFDGKMKLRNLKRLEEALGDVERQDPEAFEASRRWNLADQFGVKTYEEIPQIIKVYRGHDEDEQLPSHVNVTHDPEVAKEFGKRGVVTTYEIDKKDISWNMNESVFKEGELLVFDSRKMRQVERQESETVKITKRVRDLKIGQELLLKDGRKGKIVGMGIPGTVIAQIDHEGSSYTDYGVRGDDIVFNGFVRNADEYRYTSNAFDPNQPRDEDGRWIGVTEEKTLKTRYGEVKQIKYYKEGKYIGQGRLLGDEVHLVEVNPQERRKGHAQSIVKDLVARGAKTAEATTPESVSLLHKLGWKTKNGTTGSFTVNADEYRYQSDPDKVKLFQQWLEEQFKNYLVNKTTEDVWTAFVLDGFRRGAGKAFEQVQVRKRAAIRKAKGVPDRLSFTQETREEFLRSSFGRPVAVDKVKLLAGRSFDELKDVTREMSNKISRVLVDGLVTGKGPRQIARDMTKQVDMSYQRATVIARTEIIRAHAEGQLTAFKALGVERVGAQVEWSTAAGPNATRKEMQKQRVCQLCIPLQGIVLTVDEARGMIPRHPQCRCAWTPAGVGESSKGQKRTKRTIEAAIRESRLAAISKEKQWGKSKGKIEDMIEASEWGPQVEISEVRPKPLVPPTRNMVELVGRFEVANVFCPTGKGGGVDPTCSPPHPSLGWSKDHVTETREFRQWFRGSKVVDENGAPKETAHVRGVRDGVGGEPIVVYHGTPRGPFHEFRKDFIANPDELYYGPGFYFTEDVEAARAFSKGGQSKQATGDNPVVMSYYLKSLKPFDVDNDKIDPSQLPLSESRVARAALVQRTYADEGRSEALEAGKAFDRGETRLSYRELTSMEWLGGLGLSKTAVRDHLVSLGYDSLTKQQHDVGRPGSNRYWIIFEPTQVKSTENRGVSSPTLTRT